MKYYLVTLLTNTAGQDGSKLLKYDSLEAAIVAYHNTLATYHNAKDVKWAVVEILDEYGRVIKAFSETVDHTETESTE